MRKRVTVSFYDGVVGTVREVVWSLWLRLVHIKIHLKFTLGLEKKKEGYKMMLPRNKPMTEYLYHGIGISFDYFFIVGIDIIKMFDQERVREKAT